LAQRINDEERVVRALKERERQGTGCVVTLGQWTDCESPTLNTQGSQGPRCPVCTNFFCLWSGVYQKQDNDLVSCVYCHEQSPVDKEDRAELQVVIWRTLEDLRSYGSEENAAVAGSVAPHRPSHVQLFSGVPVAQLLKCTFEYQATRGPVVTRRALLRTLGRQPEETKQLWAHDPQVFAQWCLWVQEAGGGTREGATESKVHLRKVQDAGDHQALQQFCQTQDLDHARVVALLQKDVPPDTGRARKRRALSSAAES